MKEIIYQSTSKREIIEEGEYKGVKYAIMNLGTHPTAYVENIVYANDYDDALICGVNVHCGFTFCDPPYWKDDKSIIYLGWDYAHLGDYMGYYADGIPPLGDKKWTYEEILAEVHSVIEQLLEIKKSEQEKKKIEKMRGQLYNAGYRSGYPLKLCDGISFEMTDEDIIAEKACEDCQDKVRKETAKEILQTLWGWKDRETPLICDLYELADKYGVEVEE